MTDAMTCEFHKLHPEKAHHDTAAMRDDCEECDRDKYDFAEQAYQGKILDACETDEEFNAVMDWFAG